MVELWLMLKYDEVLSLLNRTKEITYNINGSLVDSLNDNYEDIVALYSSRKIHLDVLQNFFDSKSIKNFSQRENEIINELVKEIIEIDNKNLDFIDKKVQITKKTLKEIQKKKSVLLYSKSSL